MVTEFPILDEPDENPPSEPPADGDATGWGAEDPEFPSRVAAFLRFAPIVEAAEAARRKGWPSDTYDIVTLALAAVDAVITRQGLELEATRADVVTTLRDLAARAAPDRPAEEHHEVAVFVVNALLNRAGREGPFRYRISDYTDPHGGHHKREVSFVLLTEHDDPTRGENVLHASDDAINALLGGLSFDVQDAQAANELVLERQLARNDFGSARITAEQARLLSVRLANELDDLLKRTRRDLRTVEGEWRTAIPDRLAHSRTHIRERIEAERRLLERAQDALSGRDPRIVDAALRVDRLLRECRRRHEELHARVINARTVFLEEQERQSFRPPALINAPDPQEQVLLPLLELRRGDALEALLRFTTDMFGPYPPRLPRLYRLVHDLWSRPERSVGTAGIDETDLTRPSPPFIPEEVIAVAIRAVGRVGLPARLSTLIDACLHDTDEPWPLLRLEGAEVVALAVDWAYAPGDPEDASRMTDDVMARILGPRTVVGLDGRRLDLPGWDGDDLIVAPDANTLAALAPSPPDHHEPHPEDLP
ncbi:hypothetical protein ACQEU3_03520 [Spirillospora sp. CA-253888]